LLLSLGRHYGTAEAGEVEVAVPKEKINLETGIAGVDQPKDMMTDSGIGVAERQNRH